ncbi:MAG: glycogen synthase [Thermoleophilia bacterium]
MRILMVVAEAAPYAKVGGLGDVAGALPDALAELGHEVRVVLPRSPGVMPSEGARVAWRAPVRWGPGTIDVACLAEPFAGAPRVEARIVDAAPFTTRPLYGGPDEADRYMLLADAAVADIAHDDWRPDIIHAHDWHASPIVLRVQAARATGAPLGRARTVLTIHNMAYQGVREPAFAGWHDLTSTPAPGDVPPSAVNLLGRALAAADRVTAVSPTFAWEITTAEGAFGLDGVLALRPDPPVGIVNGIDTGAFDPATDPRIPANFSAMSMEPRVANRAALARELGLDVDDHTPIVGVVSRLVDQKGLDLLLAAAPRMLAAGARIALLGSGDAALETAFAELSDADPTRVAAHIGFDAALAQRIYAGCDVFCMPSRFEPCGLGQLIAMRYGAVPLVRRTGGLADTVNDTTGVLFDAPTGAALATAFDEVMTRFSKPKVWRAMQRAGMMRDSSWGASAHRYVEVFEGLAS